MLCPVENCGKKYRSLYKHFGSLDADSLNKHKTWFVAKYKDIFMDDTKSDKQKAKIIQKLEREIVALKANVDPVKRRSQLKKIAAILGVSMVAATGFSRIVEAASPGSTYAVLSNNAFIPPTVSDYSDLPSNPIAGQTFYIEDAGVMALWNAKKNKWTFPSIGSHDGSLMVSAAGIANGLSVLPCDGYDSGPDIVLGSTTLEVGTTGLTQTCGISELLNYGFSIVGPTQTQSGNTIYGFVPVFVLLPGFYIVTETILISPPNPIQNFKIKGAGMMSTYVYWDFAGNCFEIDHTNGNISNMSIEIESMQDFGGTNVTAGYGFFVCQYVSGDPSYHTNLLMARSLVSAFSFAGYADIIVSGFESVEMHECSDYAAGGAYGLFYGSDIITVMIIGGYLTAMYLTGSSSTVLYVNTNAVYTDYYLGGGMESVEIMQMGLHSGFTLFGPSGGAGIREIYIHRLVLGAVTTGTQTLFNLASGISPCTVGLVKIGFIQALSNGPFTFLATDAYVGALKIDAIDLSIDTSAVLTGWIGNPPTLSTNPPVSATIYQNTYAYDIRIYLPVYATTSGTSGTVAIYESASSTPTIIGTKFISGSTSSTATDIIELVVPANHYYEFTATGVTFATAVVKAA